MQGRIVRIDEGQRRLTAIALCCLLATLGWRLGTVFAILGLMIFVAVSQAREVTRLRRSLRRLEKSIGAGPAKGSVPERLEQVVDLLEETALRDPERIHQRHSATGVSTREPLTARMKAEGSGVLGVLGFVDHDRLSAFDPSLGAELIVEAAARLKAMLPAGRMLAHVDRAYLAIWFGAGIDEAAARTELDAIVYALGEPLAVAGRPVLPEVKVQLARLRNDDAGVLLARTLARLAAPDAANGQAVGAKDNDQEAKDRFAMEQDLRQAMAAGELQLRFQPLIHAGQGRVHGAEALIRWRHPQHGMISPSRFIPLIESAGLAHEIGLWAINAACREARAWQAAELHDLRMAVNVSAYQIERDDLPTLVARTLDRHGLAPQAFEIELTESAALVDSDRARKLFGSLRQLGVRLAIDDFGTGFSSLSTLRTLAFDKIKIDREFVTEVESRKESQAICQSIIALARGLGIGVLAEGVERYEEYAWLRRHGCQKFQGYFFSPPLESAAFIAFAQDREALVAKLALDPRALQQNIAERLSA